METTIEKPCGLLAEQSFIFPHRGAFRASQTCNANYPSLNKVQDRFCSRYPFSVKTITFLGTFE